MSNYFIKKILISIFPYSFRAKLKREKRKLKNILKFSSQKLSLDQFHFFLEDELHIKEGDSVIITSSFGNLNADFSPNELVELLKNLVGINGNIVMPFYPPGNSYEFADKEKIFDMNNTPSSMGILTQVFSESKNVYKSRHPTKSVVAWGENATEIITGHEYSKTPYHWGSPYGWLLKNPSKSLGLGIEKVPIFHSFEDLLFFETESFYLPDKKSLKLRGYDDLISDIHVLIHDPEKMHHLMNIGEYIFQNKPESYKRKKIGFEFCYCFSNQDAFKHFKNEFSKGNFRYKK